MDKLLDQHGLPQDFDFDKYVNDIFMKGKPLCGSFWEHLNVSLWSQKNKLIFDFQILFQDAWKYKDNPNLKFIWYEDLVSNMPAMLKELADFTGYKVLSC